MVGFSSVLHPREAGSGGRQCADLLCPRWSNGNHPSRPLAGEKRLRNRLSALVRNFLPFPENRNLWQGLSIARSSRNTENAPAGGLTTLITHLFAVSREPVLGKGLSSITLKGLIALIALFAHHFFGYDPDAQAGNPGSGLDQASSQRLAIWDKWFLFPKDRPSG